MLRKAHKLSRGGCEVREQTSCCKEGSQRIYHTRSRLDIGAANFACPNAARKRRPTAIVRMKQKYLLEPQQTRSAMSEEVGSMLSMLIG